MENASKAFIIAGAILIVILLIAVSVLVYQRSNTTISSATNQIDDMSNAIEGSNLGNTIKESINSVKKTN